MSVAARAHSAGGSGRVASCRPIGFRRRRRHFLHGDRTVRDNNRLFHRPRHELLSLRGNPADRARRGASPRLRTRFATASGPVSNWTQSRAAVSRLLVSPASSAPVSFLARCGPPASVRRSEPPRSWRLAARTLAWWRLSCLHSASARRYRCFSSPRFRGRRCLGGVAGC